MNESNNSPNINNRFLNFFNYNEKDKYEWKQISTNKDQKNKRNVFFGHHKEENKIIHVKQIILYKEIYDNKEINQVLKEIYFLVLLKNQKYFIKLNKVLLSDDKKMIFLIFKEENTVSLQKCIKSEYAYLLYIKKIFYQITFGLYLLHFNNIIHCDIKTSNIVINELQDISIIDFGTSFYKGEKLKEFTISYAAPEYLYDSENEIDEKYDMWALGVILIELYLKTNYFENDKPNDVEENKSENQLRFIISKFGKDKNMPKEEINDLINGNSSDVLVNNEENKIYKDVNDKDALDLINNLLVLNPKKRYSAKQVLESNYLKIYYKEDPIDLKELKNPIDINELNSLIDENKFQNLFNKLELELNG